MKAQGWLLRNVISLPQQANEEPGEVAVEDGGTLVEAGRLPLVAVPRHDAGSTSMENPVFPAEEFDTSNQGFETESAVDMSTPLEAENSAPFPSASK